MRQPLTILPPADSGEPETPADETKAIVNLGDDSFSVDENGVHINYTDSSLTDFYWDGTTNLTIADEAVITITKPYTQKANLTISANAKIVAENGTKVTVTDSESAFIIKNGAQVEMSYVNIERNVGVNSHNLILVDGATLTCVNVSILEDDRGVFEITNNGQLVMEGDETVILSNASSEHGRPIFDNVYGTVTIKGGKYTRTGNSGQIIGNGMKKGTSTAYIMGGELINPKGTTDTVANGTIVMTGGSITSPKAAAIRTGKAGDKVTVTGGTIHDSAIAVRLGRNNSAAAGEVIIGGDVSFSGNTVDIYLSKKSNVFTLRDDFTGRMSVKSGETLAVNEKLPITTDGTAKQMRAHVYADSKV